MSIDLNLNFKDKFIDKVGLNEGYSYTFISSTNGLPLYYSNVDITKYKDPTFTKIEFCKQNTNCTDEPYTDEAFKFNNNIFNLSDMEASKVQKHWYHIWGRVGDQWTILRTLQTCEIIDPFGFSASGLIMEVGCGEDTFSTDFVGLAFAEPKYHKCSIHRIRWW